MISATLYYLPTHKIYFDSDADFSKLSEFAVDHNLKMGSIAVDVRNGDEYLMDSLGEWHKKGGKE